MKLGLERLVETGQVVRMGGWKGYFKQGKSVSKKDVQGLFGHSCSPRFVQEKCKIRVKSQVEDQFLIFKCLGTEFRFCLLGK